MEHIFEIKHTNGKKEYLAHNFFLSSDKEAKRCKLKPLRELYRRRALKISCSCTSPKVEMLIAYREKTNTYSIRTFPGKAKEHATSCFFSSGNDDTSLATDTTYEKGYVEKNGKIEVKLDSHDFKKTNTNNLKANPAKTTTTSMGKRQNTSVSSYKSSVYALTKRLVTEAWNKSILASTMDKYPAEDKNMVYKSLKGDILWKYSIGRDQLDRIFYGGGLVGQISHLEGKSKSNSAAYTILLLEEDLTAETSDKVILSLRSPKYKELREIVVPTHLYNNALSAVNNIPAPYFIGGFLTYTSSKTPPEFLSFSLIPISDYGAPIESSFERTLFNKLSAEQRKVIRPVRETIDSSWNGFIPDGLLLDTKPKTILEVFGMSQNHLAYHEKRQIKIEHFSNLNSSYNLWYWDAFNGSSPPRLPNLN